MRMHSGDVRTEIANRLETVHGAQIVRRVDLGDDVLHRFDAQAGRPRSPRHSALSTDLRWPSNWRTWPTRLHARTRR